MTDRKHYSDYDNEVTQNCERALVTLIGDVGPWRERLYVAGGLAPRYLVGKLPEGSAEHVGTADIDLVVGVALGDESPNVYRTLKNNLTKANFKQEQPDFRWSRQVGPVHVVVEFLGETDEVAFGRSFAFPSEEKTGSGLKAFNVRGALLLRDDFVEREIEAERLDDGGISRVAIRVANVLPYVVLKTFAFQERHDNKDSYDLIFTLLNWPSGAMEAGREARRSRVFDHETVRDALPLLAERYRDPDQDGPAGYANFLDDGNEEGHARRRQDAVGTVSAFLDGLNA